MTAEAGTVKVVVTIDVVGSWTFVGVPIARLDVLNAPSLRLNLVGSVGMLFVPTDVMMLLLVPFEVCPPRTVVVSVDTKVVVVVEAGKVIGVPRMVVVEPGMVIVLVNVDVMRLLTEAVVLRLLVEIGSFVLDAEPIRVKVVM